MRIDLVTVGGFHSREADGPMTLTWWKTFF